MTSQPFDFLRANFEKRLALTTAESDTLNAEFQLRKVRKKQAIIQPGFVAQHRNFVVEGALRAYVIDHKGLDHTIQFAIEDWWITDYNSYVNQQPATMFVEALEESTILQIDYHREQALKKSDHKFETLFRMMAEKAAAFQQRRVISALTFSAEERYREFLEMYPSVVQRLPQYALASYLGMTTEFLSKIRNNRVKKKNLADL
jgi:CRP-like cAMP-binding protein